MPLLSLTTNTSLTDTRQDEFLTSLSRTVATMLGKSEDYVMVQASFSARLAFAGNTQPAAYIELKSIGLPGDKTAEFSEILCNAVTGALEIPPQRIYIEFSDAPRHMWGWNGRTFA